MDRDDSPEGVEALLPPPFMATIIWVVKQYDDVGACSLHSAYSTAADATAMLKEFQKQETYKGLVLRHGFELVVNLTDTYPVFEVEEVDLFEDRAMEEMRQKYSDFYKDVFGFRPRFYGEPTDAQIRACWQDASDHLTELKSSVEGLEYLRRQGWQV